MAYVTTTTILGSTTYTPSLSVLTGSQIQIPVGVRSASVAVNSGYAVVNGTSIPQGVTLNFGGYNGCPTLSTAINVGSTGSAASPSNVLVMWEV